MDARGSAQEVNDEAAQWVARIDSRPLDHDAKARLASWLATDERHRGALFRALTIWQTVAPNQTIDAEVWNLFDQAEPLDAESRPAEGMKVEIAPNRVTSRRSLLWSASAAAASLLAAALLSTIVLDGRGASYRRIETQLGEMTKVPLQDGSLVVVNTNSRLNVSQSNEERRVQLEEGEAWFKVAKDKSRPFVVSAGDVSVRAVGTAFSVRRREGGADVQVTDGVVEVWSQARPDKRVLVPAGARTFVSDLVGGQGLVKDPADIERELSWRQGVLKFEGSTIREAADEFNRYNMTKLQIDPAIADEKIVGRFNSDEPDTFARVVSLTFDASVEKRGGQIHIEKN